MSDSVHLTKREREVESLVHRRLTDKQIADHLCVSPKTVGHHIENILRKRGAASRYELKAPPPRVGDLVQRRGSDRVWEVFDFGTDESGNNIITLIDPNYDAQSNTPDPTLFLRDSTELFVLAAVA